LTIVAGAAEPAARTLDVSRSTREAGEEVAAGKERRAATTALAPILAQDGTRPFTDTEGRPQPAQGPEPRRPMPGVVQGRRSISEVPFGLAQDRHSSPARVARNVSSRRMPMPSLAM
jgi:hypothetical protein